MQKNNVKTCDYHLKTRAASDCMSVQSGTQDQVSAVGGRTVSKPKTPGHKNQLDLEAARAPNRRTFLQLSMLGGLTTAVSACGSPELVGPGSMDEGLDSPLPPVEPEEQETAPESEGTDPETQEPIDETPAEEEPTEPEVPDEPEEPLLPSPDNLTEVDLFGIGLSAGDARPDKVVLTTRYDGNASLIVGLWRQDPEGLTAVSRTSIETGDGGFARLELELPTPDVFYLYAFCEEEDGVLVSRSPLGRFLAPPSPETIRPIRLGASSCSYNSLPPLTLGHASQRDDLDLFCFLGDTSYNDGCSTIEEYRDSWASNLGKSQFIDLRQSTSVIATWDDHEITNDWDPESVTLDQFQNAHQAFTEAMPILRSESNPERLWRKLRWGKTLEIFALDTRSERTPSRRLEPDGEYLSRDQLDWLKTNLAESDAVFKLIMNSVPIGAYPPIFDLAAADRWEGYPHQREEILRFIEDEPISGVLWIAGDFHMACAGRISPDGPGSQSIEILAGPAAQVGNPLAWTLPVRNQFDWATSRNNYATLDFDPESGEVHVIFHGLTPFGNEEVIHEERYEIA